MLFETTGYSKLTLQSVFEILQGQRLERQREDLFDVAKPQGAPGNGPQAPLCFLVQPAPCELKRPVHGKLMMGPRHDGTMGP